MPAAMLPCPAPAGSDWSFQNPVGVDCSSPEPRCIWLAVLRSAAGSALPPALPTGPHQHQHQPRVRTDQMSDVCCWSLAVSGGFTFSVVLFKKSQKQQVLHGSLCRLLCSVP